VTDESTSPRLTIRVLNWVSLFVTGGVFLMATRYLPWLVGGMPIRFAQKPYVIVIAIVATAVMTLSRGARAWSGIPASLTRVWPVPAIVAVDFGFMAFAFLNRGRQDLSTQEGLRYWAMYAFTTLALPAGLQLGLRGRNLGGSRPFLSRWRGGRPGRDALAAAHVPISSRHVWRLRARRYATGAASVGEGQ